MPEKVEKETGGLALFLQGASGELSPRYQYVGEPAVADQHGAQLGHSVLADMQLPQTQLTFTGVVESGPRWRFVVLWEMAGGMKCLSGCGRLASRCGLVR